MNGIYIVTGYNIGNNLADMLTAFGKCRIKIDLITISDKPFRMFMLWAREGWIDYNIPQIYWEIGHKAADYETLVELVGEACGKPSIVYRSGSHEYHSSC